MAALVRDAPLGQIVRWVTKNKVLRYPEERSDFVLPEAYQHLDSLRASQSESPNPSTSSLQDDKKDESSVLEPSEQFESVDRTAEANPDGSADLEKAATRHSDNGTAISPVKTKDGVIVVDWYSEDDAENPRNWTTTRKICAAMQVYIYTTAMYISGPIITPSFPGIMQEYGVNSTQASLLLAGFVLMYGLGSLLWSPLSELPSVGRNPPYMISFGLFVAMSVALPLVHNYPGLVVLRFLQGFFGAPCLATGGASLSDLFAMAQLPFAICFWAVAATAGPSVGPLIAGYSVAAENWRWSFWEILWFAGPVFVSMFIFLPETNASNILLRKAQRLRKLTGNQQLKSQSELDQAGMSPRAIAFEALIRPAQLNLLDPSIAFTTFYVGILYSIYYGFFEAFPIVFERYNFNAGEQGLAFLSIAIATLVAVIIYMLHLHYFVNPKMMREGPGEPEARLLPAVWNSFLLPVGLFLFAWTSNGTIHWIVPLLGVFIFTLGVFILMQCIFVYLPWVYPQYAASLFAANNAARSSMAFAAILYSTPMFRSIGVSGGVSLLAGITVLCCGGIIILYVFGKQLRARSKFSAKY